MRTRRYRKGGEGAEAQSPMVQPQTEQVPEVQPQTEQVPEVQQQQAVQPQPDAQQQAANAAETIGKPSGKPDIDAAVSRLYAIKDKNYHLRALINAITICNFTMKSQSNLLNPLDPEVFLCEGRCGDRAKMVREALKILQEESDKSDVLGYISSGRGMVNSATYLGKSAASLTGKLGSAVWNAPTTVLNAPNAALNAIHNTPAALNKSGENIKRSFNALGTYGVNGLNRFDNYVNDLATSSFTQKAPVKGGRRRTRRHR